jgi:hypothetical protein
MKMPTSFRSLTGGDGELQPTVLLKAPMLVANPVCCATFGENSRWTSSLSSGNGLGSPCSAEASKSV